MSTLEQKIEDGEKHTSSDTYSDEFNLDKGVDRTYEYKCNLSMLHPFLLPDFQRLTLDTQLTDVCKKSTYISRLKRLMNIYLPSFLSLSLSVSVSAVINGSFSH
jgi:hypothetical protein